MKKAICSLLLVVFGSIFLCSVWMIIQLQGEYRSGSDTYSALESYISMPTEDPEATTRPISGNSSDSVQTGNDKRLPIRPEDALFWPVINFDALAQINPDIVAWIYIPGTNINYPVVQGKDNDYYLTHMFDRSYNRAGCIFLDVNVAEDFSAENSVLHGHNLLNSTMFAALLDYRSQSFYDEHPVALLMTPEGNYRILFFSGYVTDVRSSAWDSVFTGSDYILWQLELAEKSCFDSDVVPLSSDRIVTLSTCSYEFSNARFVIHGILDPVEAQP